MAYEVLYWNMPLCQSRCVVPNPRKKSFSCSSAEFQIVEDAVWPGHAAASDGTIYNTNSNELTKLTEAKIIAIMVLDLNYNAYANQPDTFKQSFEN